jgi:hypothetical protein
VLHPVDFVESLLKAECPVEQVQLSVYRYQPQSIREWRNVYKVPAKQLRSEYERRLAELNYDEELTFDSLVRIVTDTRSEPRHLPLVDFVHPDRATVEQATELLISEYAAPRAALFSSGRSFHLYLGVLQTHSTWVRFMGRILLLNVRGDQDVIDARWVGHRLMGGYAALRWSTNSGRHDKPVELVRDW